VGIPFIYAGSDPDFDGKYYVYQVPNKFDYINIDNVIAWYKKLPKDIRYDIRNDNIQRCSWDNIMKTIIDQL
ncbi:MAG: glycosyltransferase family 1 protein, partial [Clostridia bacterium]|nr:glycosyltransferase family 1 protein [Clostridia bacterium]